MRLFDTTFLIDLVNNRPGAVEIARQVASGDEIPAVSTITIYEYLLGIHVAYYESRNLPERLESAKRDLSAFQPIPLTVEIAEEGSRLEARTEHQGRPISINDLYIASTAVKMKIALVTRNTSDFQNIPGLKLETY